MTERSAQRECEPAPEPRVRAVGELGRISAVDDRSIGQILVDLGKLRPEDVERVYRYHRRKQLRFGEAARKLGLVSRADIRQALAIKFDYPCLAPGQSLLGPELVAAYHPDGALAEAMRELRSELLFRWFDADNRALAVLSARIRDGRSFLAANLAVLFAQWGGRTLLIDADLRSPRQHRIFNVPDQVGLSQVLCGRSWRDAVQTIPHFGRLDVLPAGPVPPNPTELLSRRELGRLLTEARKRYQVVLIDTSASCRGAEAQGVAARAGGALLLARQHRSRTSELGELIERVTSRGAQVVGGVLNQV